MSNEVKIKALVARVLKLTTDQVTSETSIENTASWDSLNTMLLIAELEEKFRVEFSIEEITRIRSVKEIVEIVNAKL